MGHCILALGTIGDHGLGQSEDHQESHLATTSSRLVIGALGRWTVLIHLSLTGVEGLHKSGVQMAQGTQALDMIGDCGVELWAICLTVSLMAMASLRWASGVGALWM